MRSPMLACYYGCASSGELGAYVKNRILLVGAPKGGIYVCSQWWVCMFPSGASDSSKAEVSRV